MSSIEDSIITLSRTEFEVMLRRIVREEVERIAPAPPDEDDTLTIAGLAEFLHCTRRTVQNHRRKGQLPRSYQVGNKVVWRRSEVVEFLKTPLRKR